MRKLLIVACALFVVFVASNGEIFAAKRPGAGLEKALCSATANCESGTITCQGNNSTTSCSATDRNCTNGQRGSVTCDGVTALCPTTCPTTTIDWCKTCDETGGCVACCRCGGGTGCFRICQEF